MITLGQTNTLQGMASVQSGITYTIFGAELLGSSESYKVLAQGQLPIFTAPLYTVAASTTAFIKRIELTNTTTGNISGINFYINGSGDVNKIKSNFTIPSNYSTVFDGDGWQTYDTNGNTLTATSINAAGSDKQIQFNNGGNALWGDANFTWNRSTNSLGLNGTDTEILLNGITTEPPAPSAGFLSLYSKAVCGKLMLKTKGPAGIDSPLQNAIWQNNTVLFTPGAAAGVWQGTVGSNLGTAALVIPTVTNTYTMMRRSTFSTLVTTTGQQIGTRTEAMFCRGNAEDIGGFFYAARFGFTAIKTGMRGFFGMAADTTALVTADPSSRVNLCGFGFDQFDTGISFIHNDNIGISTKDFIPVITTLATSGTSYDAYIWCAPNTSTVYYRLDLTSSGNPITIINGSTSTDLPINTTLLCAHTAMSNCSNISLNDAVLGVNRIYIETDR